MNQHLLALRFQALCLLAAFLVACAAPTELPLTTTAEAAAPILTASPKSPETKAPSPTAIRSPPALPEIFISEHLNPIDTPQIYIEETCAYLKNRWDSGKSAPGTVVMIVMLSNINHGDKPNETDALTVNQFNRMIENVKEQGFEAINTEQLQGFLESNQYIPPRSILFLQDGRRTAGNFNQNFRPLWEDWGWPVVNSWIIQTDSPDSLLEDNLALEQAGFVDHQLYSSLGRFSDNASEEFLSGELKKYTDIFEERYHKAPIAIIWPSQPGTHFIAAARNLGFQLGFTANTRGPVMYNWIPLAEREDLERPSY